MRLLQRILQKAAEWCIWIDIFSNKGKVMNPKCVYPQYSIELPDGIIEKCTMMAQKLLTEVGMLVPNHNFIRKIAYSKAIRIDSDRVYFDSAVVKEYTNRFIAVQSELLRKAETESLLNRPWQIKTDGFSLMIIDLESEQLREASSDDLRNMIKLANSFGIDGSYMVMPQDVPPVMQALNCFKICFESSDNIRPYDYQQPEQLPFLYDMHQVVGRTMDIVITIPSAMCIDPKDLDIFMAYYPLWKKNKNINFRVLDYPMTAITKPLGVCGCAAMCFAETLGTHILFNLFDPDIKLDISMHGGLPTDLRNTCWAFGSPRAHLFRFLTSMILPNLCKIMPASYQINDWVHLETSSPAIDEQAAMEKMGCGLVAAMQGARQFRYAGVLCVDDVYSGAQFVIDVEIVDYIRETIEAFNPHHDIIAIEGLYEECRDVALGKETFVSSENTFKRFKNVIPSPKLIVREKLRSWLNHKKLIKDRAREIAIETIRTHRPFSLPADKQSALDMIYAKALKTLT